MSVYVVALLAGCMAIFATVCIAHFGGKLGGLLGSIPTTIVPGTLGFFWHARTPADLTASLSVVPIGMLINAIFLYAWRVIPPYLSKETSLYRRLGTMSALSLGVWGCTAALFMMGMQWRPTWFEVLWVGILGQFTLLTFGIWACRSEVPAPKGKRPVSLVVLLSRGLLAGCAVGCSAWISSLGFPILAGMASVFPAIFLTTMVSIWLSQGEAVQAGAVGPMMLGSSSVALYALLCIVTLPSLGGLWGVLVAWIAAVLLVSLPAWWWLTVRSQSVPFQDAKEETQVP